MYYNRKEVEEMGYSILPILAEMCVSIEEMTKYSLGECVYNAIIRKTDSITPIMQRQEFWKDVTTGLTGQICETLCVDILGIQLRGEDAINKCEDIFGVSVGSIQEQFWSRVYLKYYMGEEK